MASPSATTTSSAMAVRNLNVWWQGIEQERYWLEVTDRIDVGSNLKAPQTKEDGKTSFWSYSLINLVQPGDTVFHYDRAAQAIIGSSLAAGTTWTDDIVWAARGTSARTTRVTPHPRPGYYLGLEHFEKSDAPLALQVIREHSKELTDSLRRLEASSKGPSYFPFAISEKREIRPNQGYLFKLPAFFVSHFHLQRESNPMVVALALTQASTRPLGVAYRSADEECAVGHRDPFTVDPSLVERGLRGHAVTQNLLSKYLQERGMEPRSPSADEPEYDVAWETGDATWVCEVKSLTVENEEKQLRLGLGQVLRYRHLLQAKGEIRAALILERSPTDLSWIELCKRLGVSLAWPGNWSVLS